MCEYLSENLMIPCGCVVYLSPEGKCPGHRRPLNNSGSEMVFGATSNNSNIQGVSKDIAIRIMGP